MGSGFRGQMSYQSRRMPPNNRMQPAIGPHMNLSMREQCLCGTVAFEVMQRHLCSTDATARTAAVGQLFSLQRWNCGVLIGPLAPTDRLQDVTKRWTMDQLRDERD